MYLDWYRLFPWSWAEEETFGAGAPELARGFLFQVSGLVGGVNFWVFLRFWMFRFFVSKVWDVLCSGARV